MSSPNLVFHLHNLRKQATLWLKDRAAVSLIQQVRREGLTYLEPAALVDLYTRVKMVEDQELAGIMIEAGCALGGSAIVMTAAKQSNRPFFLYDTFEMIPPPSTQDGEDAHQRYNVIVSGQAGGLKGKSYYGYQENLLTQVTQTFVHYGFPLEQHHLHFIKGLYEETLVVSQPVALAHIDCDWYDSVMTCLQQITPNLVPGGVLIIDDYADWSGCRRAVDTYFASRQAEFIFEMKSRLHIIRR
ncbi:MAG: class I SAM-dependent methyltransferase [Anaerolineae bacterium]|nr:class I SAM-dependent methyltransferase [Anaerolineae bacterium]